MLFVSIDRHDLAIPVLFYHFLHKADVVVLGQIPVFQKVRTFMRRHRLNQMVDDFVRYERVSKVELSYIRLKMSVHVEV